MDNNTEKENPINNQIKHLEALKAPYRNNGIADPMGALNITDTSAVDADYVNILAAESRRPPNKIYTLDTETFGGNASRLHLGYMYSPEDGEFFRFRHWHTPHDAPEQTGIIEHLENILLSLVEVKESQKINVYAHNGSGFDFVGLALEITCNTALSSYWLERPESAPKLGRGYPEILSDDDYRHYRRGIWANASKLERKRSFINAQTGRKNTAKITWRLKKAGRRSYIEISMKRHSIFLFDSMWHLNMPLKKLGAKGKTPRQYTEPYAWMREQNDLGNIPEGTTWEQHWFNTVTDEAEEYCQQDCVVLADALMNYRRIYGELFKHPRTGEPVDPLSYMTVSQSALAGMILSSKPPSTQNGNNSALIHRPGIGWQYTNSAVMIAGMLQEGAQFREVPFADKNELVITPSGWLQWQKYLKRWDRIQFGGRTEIFQPRNKKNTKVVSLDVNSLYSAMMFDLNKKYFDPRYIRPLEKNIRGRAAILKHLESYGGMYLIKTAPAKNMIFREIPVFPVRLRGEDRDGRLCFPDWEGIMALNVTSEELQYFLENTEVENDDIEVIAEGSFYSNLISSKDTPFHHFAGKVFRKRQLAEKEQDNISIKQILNSGGFGTLLQTNDDDAYLQELNEEMNERTIQRMMALSPEWEAWAEYKDGSKDAFTIAGEWADDHYRSVNKNMVYNPDGRDLRQLKVSLPNKLASHAIRAFGCSIPAHGRVTLHRGMVAVRRVVLQPGDTQTDIKYLVVLYVDTDSMKIQVPIDMPMELVIKRLEEIKTVVNGKEQQALSIGNNLGEWKVEKDYANPELVTPDADVTKEGDKFVINNPQAIFFAPKHYYITDTPKPDGSYNVLRDVVKVIPRKETLQRTTMYTYHASVPKLGDSRGLRIQPPTAHDLMHKVGVSARRLYNGNQYSPSKPMVIRHVDDMFNGASYIDYIRAISSKTRGSSKAIQEAIEDYKKNARIQGESYLFKLNECINAFNRLCKEILEREQAQQSDEDLPF